MMTAKNPFPIGILGGTFDPIHYGHLRAALELYQSLPLQEIRFIPCQTPVHKANALAAPEHRLAMLQLALQGLPFASFDERELRRPTPSYMVETLTSLRLEFTNHPLCLIIGTDALANFTSWYRWQDILTLAHLIVIKRPGYGLIEMDSVLMNYQQTDVDRLFEHQAGGLFLQTIAGLPISSTQIRGLLSNNKSPRYLLPDSVLQYIEIHKLYA